jgi:hypothetical protein
MTRCLRAAIGAAVFAVAACGPGIEVHTVVAPEASLKGLTTFRILRAPTHRGGAPLDTRHPMLVNSITNHAIRGAIEAGLIHRGYLVADSAPDFEVAFYASARDKLDVTYWDYGYPWRPRWWRGWGRGWGGPTVTQYTEGSVIIDVLDASSRDLLWRGHGVSVVSDEPHEYVNNLKETVRAILDRFPKRSKLSE